MIVLLKEQNFKDTKHENSTLQLYHICEDISNGLDS